MSTKLEKLQAIKHAVEFAKRWLKELDDKTSLTLAEGYLRDMTIEYIQRGERLLGKGQSK